MGGSKATIEGKVVHVDIGTQMLIIYLSLQFAFKAFYLLRALLPECHLPRLNIIIINVVICLASKWVFIPTYLQKLVHA